MAQSQDSTRPAVLFTAFEPSGDALAAPVIRRLRRDRPDWAIYAWGGPLMEEAGAEMAGRTSEDGAMGLGALAHARKVKKTIGEVKRWIHNCRLMVHVPVDSPAANFPICRASRKAGARIVHLAAPQMWAWGSWRVGKLRKLTDHVMCLLPFEPAWFGSRDIRASFVGHPAINRELDPDELRGRFHGLPHGTPRLALFPGSRTQEVARNIKLLAGVFEELRHRHSGLAGLIVAPSSNVAQVVRRKLGEFSPNMNMTVGMRDEAIAWSDLSIAVSGTVTLDIMRQCSPMIGVYKTGILSVLGAKLLLRTKYRLLPNIIADDLVVPEYVPWCRGIGPIVSKAAWLLDDSRRVAEQQQGLRAGLAGFKGRQFDAECAAIITRTVGA